MYMYCIYTYIKYIFHLPLNIDIQIQGNKKHIVIKSSLYRLVLS